MPGMVNAHHHNNGVSAIRQGIRDSLLESWLISLSLGRRPTLRLATLLSAARLLRTGVTSVVDVHSDRGTADSYAANAREALAAYDDAGIRVAFAAGLMTQCFLVSGAREAAEVLGRQTFRSADAGMVERLRRHVEAYYLEWEVPDLAPWTVYNTRG